MNSGFFSSSLLEKGKPQGSIPKCGTCGLYKTCQSPKMAPYGHYGKRVIIVGEAPGQSEDEQGRPFIGKAGQFLREKLDEIDVDMDRDALTTNAIICRPPKNATPDAKQIDACYPNIKSLVIRSKPLVILTLGKTALSSVLGRYWDDIGALERWVGWRIPVNDYWVCPTYHPSYLLREHNTVMDRMFVAHLERAFSTTKAPKPLPDWKQLIHVSLNEEEVCETLEQIEENSDWAAVDYETNCLKPEWPKGHIYSCAVSNGKRTISYPWTKRTAQATRKLLVNTSIRKIASNLKMEERWTLETFGHGVKDWGWDTMLASHCLDNRPGICSLKFQSFVKMGVPVYNRHIAPYLQSNRGPYNRIAEAPLQELLFYGGMDALLEYKLAMRQRKEMGYE